METPIVLLCFFSDFYAFTVAALLTVLMRRPNSIHKLLATDGELVTRLGLLNFDVIVQRPPGNCLQTPLHLVVLPVTPHTSVILVVVQIENLVAPVVSCGHVLERPGSNHLVCILRGSNRLLLLLLFFLWVFLQMKLSELQLGTVNSTP